MASPKKRIRIITKKQKVVETNNKVRTASLEQTIQEPTFMRGRARRMPRLPLTLPFGQAIQNQTPASTTGTTRTPSEIDTPSREAFSYERPGGTQTTNGTYRIPGATDANDNQLYRSTGTDNKIEADRQDRFNPTSSDTNRLQGTNTLGTQTTRDAYQSTQHSYQSSTGEKKNVKELERSKL